MDPQQVLFKDITSNISSKAGQLHAETVWCTHHEGLQLELSDVGDRLCELEVPPGHVRLQHTVGRRGIHQAGGLGSDQQQRLTGPAPARGRLRPTH